MLFHLLADGVLVLHAAFVVFVVAGGFLVARRRAVAWLHAPCVLWGAWVEFSGWVCPLTPLEGWLRLRAGEAAAGGDFVQRWILFALYPDRLPRGVQIALGLVVLGLNAGLYAALVLRSRAKTHP